MAGWTGSGQVERSDGTRSGSRTWQDARDADQDVNAAAHDAHDEILALAIAACLNLDGENSPRAAISWGSQRITNLAAATARNDAIRLAQVQDAGPVWGGTTGGTANLQTITLSPAPPALPAGLTIRLFVGLTNTGALQVTVNGIAPVSVLTRGGSALQAGEWRISTIEEIVFDGTDFRLTRSFTRRRLVTASETYTVPAGLMKLRTRGVGAGGGGGGVSGSNMAGGGGGAGAYCEREFAKGDLAATVAITIGAAGSAGSDSGGDGGTGGDTSFGSHWTAGGGSGGTGMTSSTNGNQVSGGAGGTASGSPDLSFSGVAGNVGRLDSGTEPMPCNHGGKALWEYGGLGNFSTNGAHAPTGYGSGGTGGNRTSAAGPGIAGRQGAIELVEQF